MKNNIIKLISIILVAASLATVFVLNAFAADADHGNGTLEDEILILDFDDEEETAEVIFNTEPEAEEKLQPEQVQGPAAYESIEVFSASTVKNNGTQNTQKENKSIAEIIIEIIEKLFGALFN